MPTLPASSASSQQASIDAALLVLKSMGLSLDDLTSAPRNRPPVPTFAEYVPVVSATLTPATLRAYGSYWKRVIEQWGDRHLDEPTPSEVKQLVAYFKANAVQRSNSRTPISAAHTRLRLRRRPQADASVLCAGVRWESHRSKSVRSWRPEHKTCRAVVQSARRCGPDAWLSRSRTPAALARHRAVPIRADRLPERSLAGIQTGL